MSTETIPPIFQLGLDLKAKAMQERDPKRYEFFYWEIGHGFRTQLWANAKVLADAPKDSPKGNIPERSFCGINFFLNGLIPLNVARLYCGDELVGEISAP